MSEEERARCERCGSSYCLTETYDFGDRTVCMDCAQAEIDRQRDILHGVRNLASVSMSLFEVVQINVRSGHIDPERCPGLARAIWGCEEARKGNLTT